MKPAYSGCIARGRFNGIGPQARDEWVCLRLTLTQSANRGF